MFIRNGQEIDEYVHKGWKGFDAKSIFLKFLLFWKMGDGCLLDMCVYLTRFNIHKVAC